MRTSTGTAAGLLALMALAPHEAFALQHRFGAAHQEWSIPDGDNYTMEQRFIVDTESPQNVYYALQFGFDPNPRVYNGYIGLQPADANNGKQALFSIWGAKNAAQAQGAHCQSFEEFGAGLQCFLPLPQGEVVTGATYTFRLRPIDLNDPDGPWWEGALLSADGGERVIGWIQAPVEMKLIRQAVSFVEYYGVDADGTCDCLTLPPMAKANFAQPLLNSSTYAGYGSDQQGNCSGGRVTRVPDYLASVIELGVGSSGLPGPDWQSASQCEPCTSSSQCATTEFCLFDDRGYGYCEKQ
jgi:hypothetical protein